MHFTVSMQDPTCSETTYLYEAILSAAQDAASWQGFYAFATRDGVDQLIEDNTVHELMERGGQIRLVVGLDAITNRSTLERLLELEHQYPNFTPRVFWNETSALFHPKISDFGLTDGRRIVIVGSGNLTPGGLRNNFEAYAVAIGEPNEDIDMASLTSFVRRHANHITPINEQVLSRADSNSTRPIEYAKRAPTTPFSESLGQPDGFGRVLLAQVPKAGDRWAQVHFNAEVIQKFFNLRNIASERVYLTRALPSGRRGPIEVRRCIYSQVNKNYKIEIGGARGLKYPSDSRYPLLVFYERQLRTYDYLLIMPSDSGYNRLLNLVTSLPSLGRGFHRSVTDISTLAQAWPECPLLGLEMDDYQVF